MRALTFREYLLIAIMLLLGIGAAGRYGYQQLESYKSTIEAERVLKQKQLEIVGQLEKEWAELNRRTPLPVIPQVLKTFVENGVKKLKLEEKQHNLQMNDLSSVPENMEGIQVKLEQLNLDQMFDILFFLEDNKPVVLVEQMEISNRPGTDLLRLNLRIYKQKYGESQPSG
ncbi:MAG: hypothetical protein HQM13_07495 [SAR324 cluster bacterium]|nr:hypothetical protein [SAR324 cluster bacterium]